MARVLIPLPPGCEELEAVTIIDLMRRAEIDIVSAGLDDQPVTASRGVVLVPDTTLDQAAGERFDMIVLPGGLPGTMALKKDPRIRALLVRMSQEGKYVAAICAAPSVLAEAGLLDNRRAVAYPGVLEGMDLPKVTLIDAPVVEDGRLITSRGPGTAMDFALTLIETLAGKPKRDQVEEALKRP